MKIARSMPVAAPPDLVAEIDALRDKLEARLNQFVAEERTAPGGTLIPEPVHRNLLLPNESNIFAAMRRLLIEREAR